MLHRITEITLKPEPKPRSRNSKNERSSKITAKNMTFEFLSLKAGKNRDSFEDFKSLANSDKKYDEILKRNIFGPGNVAPEITTSNKTTTEGRAYPFKVTASDDNKDDLLKFELLESDIDDAVLSQKKPTDKNATIKMPAMPPGKYNFKVKVSDNGYPAKSFTKDLVVTVNKKRAATTKTTTKEKPPEPEVDYITLVKVTGFKTDRDGKLRVWISLLPTDKRLKLAEGEKFKVGKEEFEKEYEVVSVGNGEAKFEGDGKVFVASPDWKTRGALIPVESEDL